MPSRQYSAFFSKVRLWPMVQSASLKAPVPTGCLPKSPAAASTASCGTMEAKLSAMTCRKVASGRLSVISTVSGSITFTPSRLSASPDATAS